MIASPLPLLIVKIIVYFLLTPPHLLPPNESISLLFFTRLRAHFQFLVHIYFAVYHRDRLNELKD